MASASTSRVETTVAVAELIRNGAKSRSKIARYWSSVGAKNSFGGLVKASASCLKPVRNIQKTGKKKPMAATHASVGTSIRLGRKRPGLGVLVSTLAGARSATV